MNLVRAEVKKAVYLIFYHWRVATVCSSRTVRAASFIACEIASWQRPFPSSLQHRRSRPKPWYSILLQMINLRQEHRLAAISSIHCPHWIRRTREQHSVRDVFNRKASAIPVRMILMLNKTHLWRPISMPIDLEKRNWRLFSMAFVFLLFSCLRPSSTSLCSQWMEITWPRCHSCWSMALQWKIKARSLRCKTTMNLIRRERITWMYWSGLAYGVIREKWHHHRRKCMDDNVLPCCNS